jgi:hypothetical protein
VVEFKYGQVSLSIQKFKFLVCVRARAKLSWALQDISSFEAIDKNNSWAKKGLILIGQVAMLIGKKISSALATDE